MMRSNLLRSLREQPDVDIAIIGGGATGLGVAVDAAQRGYRTVLLECEDFAKGTSGRSTKLVHGGVRYLEQGDIPLVMEALRERGLLHRNAPHLVHHLSFIVPRYRWWEGPFFGIGLKLYDALAGKLNLAPSRLLSRAETLSKIPNVEPENLLGGVQYFDGQFDDSRLAISLCRTAIDHGAVCLNYCRVTGLLRNEGLVQGLQVEDRESGECFEVRARCVVNATGIFADRIRAMDEPGAPAIVQPSQGVHLVLDRSFLPGDSAIMVPHTDDGRVLFVIPWHGKVLVGTTDTPLDSPSIEPRPLQEEIGFILRNAGRYLARDPQPSDILCAFAGQRPLVRPPSKDGMPTKAISRNHEVLVSSSGLVTVVGGKWTTYRQMAEDTMEHAIVVGELSDRPCATRTLRLHGWVEKPERSTEDPLRTYGADLPDLLALYTENAALADPIHERLPYPKACIIWAARHELARTVEDVLARRTRCLLLDAAAAMEAAQSVAELLAAELGMDANWVEREVQHFRQTASGYLPT